MIDRLMTDEYFTTYILIITGSMLFVILLTLIYTNIELKKETKKLNKLAEEQRKIIARNRLKWLSHGIVFDDEDDSDDYKIDYKYLNKSRSAIDITREIFKDILKDY